MKRTDKYPDTETFTYYNANPKNRLTSDCVVRAISTALNESYEITLQNLCKLSLETGYSVGSKELIKAYLKKYLFTMQKQPKHTDGSKYTGKQFCMEHRTGRYIAMIGGHHIVAIVDGHVIDTWDSTDKCIGNYWVIK